MSETIVETIYVGHDNAVELQLTEDGVAADLSGVTKVIVDFGAFEVSSDDHPTLITWAGSTVSLKLGTIAGIGNIGDERGTAKARLIVFSPTNLNGVVWLDVAQLKFKIKQPYG